MARKETNFKQTDIGLIPHDWEVEKLEDITSFPTSKIRSTDINVCTYISTENMLQNNLGVLPFNGEVLPSNVREYKRGDILVSNIRPYLRKSYLATQSGGCSSDVIVFRPLGMIRSDYLHMCLSSSRYATEVTANSTGTKMPRGCLSFIRQFQVPLPTIEEQKRIAEVLSHFDEHIDNLVALLEKRKQVKAATMHALLSGATRLPGFTQPWEDVTLGKIVDLQSGFAFPSANYSTGGKHIVITIANVQNGRLDLSSYNRINQLPANLPLHCLLEKGDLLVTMTGNVGRVCIVTESNCVLNQRVGKLVVKEEICTEFLFHVLNSSAFEEEMIENGQGGAQPNISKVDIESFAFLIPSSVKEQEAIADILSNMDQGIETLEEQIEKYRQMKEGAMEELLTGKVRLI